MRPRVVIAIGALLALTVSGAAVAKKNSGQGGFLTQSPPYLVPTAGGVEIEPILTTGDTLGDYQMSGIPDGLGAFRAHSHSDRAKSRGKRSRHGWHGKKRPIELLMNHELAGGAPEGVGTRISHLSLNPHTRGVLDASYPVDGTEGFLRFCSSTLAILGGDPWYFTGEETTDDGDLTPDPTDGLGRGGSSIALDPETGNFTETRHFGLFAHENVVPVKKLSEAVILSPEDGPAGVSQLYAYIAPSFDDAISGDSGSLYVWKADDGQGLDSNPSTNDIAEGETLEGHFVPITEDENADAETLESAVQAKSSFDFVRPEDASVARSGKGTVYWDDTGAAGQESVRGRLYKMQFDPHDPTAASIELLLDGDRQAADNDPVQMTNPDNLDVSKKSIVIQEDRNSEHRGAEVQGGFGRVLVYDISSGVLKVVARVNTPDDLAPGTWESSGVIWGAPLGLGKHTWLLDVQAHDSTASQPGRDLVPDSSTGEDGQLLAIKIPGS